MKTIGYAYATDKGRKRSHNEDSYLADAETGLFVIADGMGGYEAGATASAIVVQSVLKDVSNGMALEKALNTAHHRVLQSVEKGIGRPGMGATVVALKIEGSDYRIAWVGDSRAYLWDPRLGKSGLKRLTHDHSFVQKMMDSGVISENEARLHPQRNILTQALGAVELTDVAAETVLGAICHGQKILLCSDGLTTELADVDIEAIMARNLTDQACAEALLNAANAQEGKDNITVIMVSFMANTCRADNEDDTLPMDIDLLKQSAGARTGKRTIYRAFLGAFLFLAIAAGAYWGYLNF